MAREDIFQNNPFEYESEYMDYNYQRIFNSNMIASNISTFAGSYNDVIRRTNFDIDFNNINTNDLEFYDLTRRTDFGIDFAETSRVEKQRTGFNQNFSYSKKRKQVKRLNAEDRSKKPYESYIIIYANGAAVAVFDRLPISPDSVSDSTSASYNSQPFVGRSSPTQVYTGTNARQMTVSFKIHYELATKGLSKAQSAQEIQRVKSQLAGLRKAVYPKLLEPGYIPTYVKVKIGNFATKGICTSISYNWMPPIVNGEFYCCEVSMNIEQILPEDFKGIDSINEKEPQDPFSDGQGG